MKANGKQLKICCFKSIMIINLLFTIFICSCNSKETPVDELDELTEEMTENSNEYSDDDWEEALSQYQQIEVALEKHRSDYTDEEIKEIGKKKGRCLALFAKRSAKDLKENLKDIIHEASGLIEGFTEGFNE